MAKEKQIFFCKECGNESAKWLGQCPACKEWNSFVEERVKISSQKDRRTISERPKPVSIIEVSTADETRILTEIKELDRVLGGGIVKGSLILVGGDPGIGKSTLLLQMCHKLIEKQVSVLYVSGEESPSQIKMRAERLGTFAKDMKILCDNDMDNIEMSIANEKSDIVVIDSIQTMVIDEVGSAAGTVTQVREVTSRLMQIAKKSDVAVFVVGHVTKEGTVAGPRTLEHMVDTVLYFEGDGSNGFRILRGVKNRFGSTNEIGVFEMSDKGLCEIDNPSQALLKGRPEGSTGSVIISSVEGTRPIMLEVQALVCQTNFNMPRRTSVGIDFNRVNLVIAVLEKRLGLNLWGYDVYVSIAGGMRIYDPASDLGIAFAIISSYKNVAIDSKMMIIGEIGLTGEIRGVSNVSQRVKEAVKMGFTTCLIPKSNYEKDLILNDVKIIPVSTLAQAIEIIN